MKVYLSDQPKGTPSCTVCMVSSEGISTKKGVSSALKNLIGHFMKEKLFSGAAKECLFAPGVLSSKKHLLLLGLGNKKTVSLETLRCAMGLAFRALEKKNIKDVHVPLSFVKDFEKCPATLAQALTEAWELSGYDFNKLQSRPKKRQGSSPQVLYLSSPDTSFIKEAKKGVSRGQQIAKCVNFARELADHPANLMTPAILARSVQTRAKGISGLKVEVWEKAKIKQERLGGLLGVSLGSVEEPRAIFMKYTGSPKKEAPSLCFVGKGLTFDSGGISIKPAGRMDEMKYDMCGSVAVIGAMLAISGMGLKVNAVGMVGSTENMPGPAANKPGDILTARNGTTMEVLNTDAEGRLVLADMLSLASEQNMKWIIDCATLTGAVVIALGNIHSGLFTRDKNLEQLILSAGSKTGEGIWPLPLNDFHKGDVKGSVGDVKNIADPGVGANSSTAAAFLEHFVSPKIPWAHLDIAGTADNVAKRQPYYRSGGASGVMVRTFVELAKMEEALQNNSA